MLVANSWNAKRQKKERNDSSHTAQHIGVLKHQHSIILAQERTRASGGSTSRSNLATEKHSVGRPYNNAIKPFVFPQPQLQASSHPSYHIASHHLFMLCSPPFVFLSLLRILTDCSRSRKRLAHANDDDSPRNSICSRSGEKRVRK
jgi:hypothetical protein